MFIGKNRKIQQQLGIVFGFIETRFQFVFILCSHICFHMKVLHVLAGSVSIKPINSRKTGKKEINEGENQTGKKMTNRKCLTFTGKCIDIFDLESKDICLEDIAHALAVKTRFNGASCEPYSIAQHCCLCAAWALPPLDKRIALLHDAEEGYSMDIPGPWKKDSPWKEADELGIVLREKIWEKYIPDLEQLSPEQKDYRDIDHQVLIAEFRALVHNWQVISLGNEFLVLPIEILPVWSWQEAERMFLLLAQTLAIKD